VLKVSVVETDEKVFLNVYIASRLRPKCSQPLLEHLREALAYRIHRPNQKESEKH
jgi:hypothetical protein